MPICNEATTLRLGIGGEVVDETVHVARRRRSLQLYKYIIVTKDSFWLTVNQRFLLLLSETVFK